MTKSDYEISKNVANPTGFFQSFPFFFRLLESQEHLASTVVKAKLKNDGRQQMKK